MASAYIRRLSRPRFDYHPIWRRMVRFVEALDVERIRRRAGLRDSLVD